MMQITRPVKGKEPSIPDGPIERIWLSSMMTWYASNRPSDIKGYAIKFGKKEGINGLENVPDKAFNILTSKIIVSRLLDRGFDPQLQMPSEAERIKNHIEGLKVALSGLDGRFKKPIKKQTNSNLPLPKPLVLKKVEESQNVTTVLNELDVWFDSILKSGRTGTRFASLILEKPSEINQNEKSIILQSIEDMVSEYTSPEIAFTEGYENLIPLQKSLKRELKRTKDVVSLWTVTADAPEETKIKKVRKPRAVSPVVSAKRLAKLKDKLDTKLKYDHSGLKPSQIFSSKIAVFWNKKYSQLIIAEGQPDLAIEGATLSKDGSNIPVFVKRVKNIENIVQARKNDSVFRNILKDFLDARGKVSMKPSMRVSSEDLVIVKVFPSISSVDQKKLDTLRTSLTPTE